MLDMGFIPDIEEICTKLPAVRQTLLFSATMPAPIKKLSDKFLSNPKTVEAARPATAAESIDQRLVRVDSRRKLETLVRLLKAENVKNAIIFANRKTTVRELASNLKRSRFAVGQIHGDMEQPERIAELDRFKSGEITILVASDVAARGLDIKGVSHVFNYDVPWQPDDYIHRIGRTGRAGKTGTAITLATKDDAEVIAAIEKLMGLPIKAMEGEAPHPEASRENGAAEPAPRPAKREQGRSARGRAPKPEPAERAAAKPAERSERPVSKPAERAQPAGSKPRRAETPREDVEAVDEGWNGPVPGFLGQRLSD
jgi:superfamily II DNA/RNA helicase